MKKQVSFWVLVFVSFAVLYSFMGHSEDKGQEIVANPEYSNLKILPKDISEEELVGVMKNFNASLGVKCSFCHAPGTDGKLNFASDENKHKDVARGMMKMTMGINKKYFKTKNPKEFQVTCFTCHNGNKHPEKTAPIPEPKR